MKLENSRFLLEEENGVIIRLEERESGANLAGVRSKLGSACFTRVRDDIRVLPHEDCEPYADCTSHYDSVVREGDALVCRDTENRICTRIRLEEDGLTLSSETDNGGISLFGLNLDLNFLGKKGGDFRDQVLPTSPYSSPDGKYQYCIMPRPNGSFLVAAAQTSCDGWRIKYSPYCCGHFILNFQFLASFDRVYGGSGRKALTVGLRLAGTLDEAFEMVSCLFGVPLCRNLLGGGFDGEARVLTVGRADELRVKAPDGREFSVSAEGRIPLDGFGMYTVTPYFRGVPGMSTTVWSGGELAELFDRSCDGIRRPYHPDDNLCEGGCFLWAMLVNMRLHGHRKYDGVAREQLDIITGKGEPVHRRTILPYPAEGYAAYHVYKSGRVQEQFFGASILLEYYRVYGESWMLDYAVAAMGELADHYMEGGRLVNGEGVDYTTVCCPMIPIADLAVFLRSIGDVRAERFDRLAGEMAEFLYRRGFDFPTETSVSSETDVEREDGSISCTALALLYYCARVRFVEKYADFAGEVLKLHRAWTIYTPDVRMQNSSFRWWETLWEGDGQGPAICCGHAWTIWKAEALFYYGLLRKDDQALLDSWNGFLTNFSKTQADGRMYSCYEVDFIRGGGLMGIKTGLRQLEGEDLGIRYAVAHSYPEHEDNSLSRYAWVRGAETWLRTGALLRVRGETVAINLRRADGGWEAAGGVEQVYISPELGEVSLKTPGVTQI